MSEETNSVWTRVKRGWEVMCGLLLFVAVTVSVAEIVLRVGFHRSIDLFFDFSVWITVWALMLITGLLLPEGGHLSIDFLRHQFRGAWRWLLEVVLALITLGYGLLITYGSILFIQQLYQRQSIFPRYIAVPKWIVELCVPISMGIFSAFAIAGLIRAIRTRW